jgi:hypothetical protein
MGMKPGGINVGSSSGIFQQSNADIIDFTHQNFNQNQMTRTIGDNRDIKSVENRF